MPLASARLLHIKVTQVTSPRQRDRVIIVISDPSRIDLEWVLPLIDELAAENINLEIFDFSAPVPRDHSNYWVRALRLIGYEPSLSADLEPVPSSVARTLDLMRSSKNYALSLLGAWYFSAKSPLNALFPFTSWREKKRREKIFGLMESASCIFTPLRKKDRPETLPEGELLAAARESGVPIIGFPMVADQFLPHRTVMQCDYALVNTAPQVDTLPAHRNTVTVAAMPPKFTQRWLGRLNQIYERLAEAPRLPADRDIVLVILKNDTSVIWSGLDFFGTARHLIDRLLIDGAFLVLKPHPRQSPSALRRLTAGLDHNDFCVAEGPLSYWAQRADRVVSLFSGGSLDALAVGKVPILFWPLADSFSEKMNSERLDDSFAKLDESGRPTTRYSELCHEVTSEFFELPSSIDDSGPLERFRALYPATKDCRQIKALIPAYQQQRGQPHDQL